MKNLLLLAFVTLLHGTAFADIQVRLHFSPIANLVYQLDCVSGALPHCSRETYQKLWESDFIQGEDARAKIRSWGELMNRYRPELEFDESRQGAVAGRSNSVKLSTKIRIASFQSMTLDEYFSRLDLVVTPKDREKFETVIRHFHPAFNKWWKAKALPKGKRFARATETLLKSPAMATRIRQFAHFYAAILPDNYTVHFNLFYRPESKEATSGQQIENYSVAEFLPEEKASDRIDVVIHELCHFFFETVNAETFAVLPKGFLENSGKIEARAAYHLLNETLATALGNGLISKLTMKKSTWDEYSARERSFYNDSAIDKAAKAILPWMEKWVNEGKTLYDPQFIAEYLSSLERAFGKELTAPRLILKELVLVADSGYNGKFSNPVRQSFRTSSMYISEGKWSDDRLLEDYKTNTTLSALLIVHPSHLDQLKTLVSRADFDRIRSHYQRSKQVLFSFRRAPSVPAYIIVAEDYEKAVGLIEKMGSMTQGFEGAYDGP